MNAGPGSRERMLELLCDRALEGLGPHEESELAQLVALHRGGLEDASYEIAAAAVMLSVRDPGAEPLPQHLAQKVWTAVYPAPVAPPAPQQQQQFAPGAPGPWPVASSGGPTVISPMQPRAGTIPIPPQLPVGTQVSPVEGGGAGMPMGHHPGGPPQGNVATFPYRPEAAPVSAEAPRPRRWEAMRWAGWLAAAACLVLAIGGWWPRPPTEIARGASLTVPRIDVPAPTTTPVDRREALLREGGAVKVDWEATKDEAAKSASGDVVWSTTAQRGYMRFKGLEANDPQKAQYQLWIFDEEQDERFPVDGGVFDVDPTTGEVVVEIDPKIKVAKPTLFAITVERPGGVVVSKRERIVLTAAVKG